MNITIKIPDMLGKRAKHFAIDEGKSLSTIVTELLAQRLETIEKSGYRQAQAQAWQLMQQGLPDVAKGFKHDKLYQREQKE